MSYQVNALEILAENFRRLPGIGAKSAQRLAFHVLNMPNEQAQAFAEAIINAKNQIHRCPECCNLTDSEKCTVCGEESKHEKHIAGPEATEDEAQVCSVCGYELAPKLEHTHDFGTEYIGRTFNKRS